MANVTLPAGVWVDLYDATGFTVGAQIETLNITPNDVRLAYSAATPVVADNHVPLLFGRGSARNTSGDPGAWALCVAGGAIDVQEV